MTGSVFPGLGSLIGGSEIVTVIKEAVSSEHRVKEVTGQLWCNNPEFQTGVAGRKNDGKKQREKGNAYAKSVKAEGGEGGR